MKRLALVTTHPIQYNAPFFKQLAQSSKIQLKVFYTLGNTAEGYYDEKFQREIKWDIPLLDEYDYCFVKNSAKQKTNKRIFGIKNPTLIGEIKNFKPDAILVYGWRHYSHLRAMMFFKGKVTILFRGDSTLIDINSKFKLFIKTTFLKFIYSFIDYALYVGTNNKKYFEKCGLKEKQLIFTPHSIDNDRFFDKNNIYKEKAEQWRKNLGIESNEKVVLFVGKFEKVKNIRIIIEAAKKITQTKFILVGNGSIEEELKSQASENIFFIPFQNQLKMPIVYNLGNILLLTSLSETWGLVVNEAMACGLPIVVSNKVGCAVDLVQNGINGYIFQYQNVNDLIDKISLTLKQAETMSINSINIIKNWSYSTCVKEIEKLLDNL